MLETIIVKILNAVTSHGSKAETASGLFLGHTVENNRLVYLPQARRFEHAVIVGKTGSGKTHAMESLAYQHFERGEGFCFFDFHGDATEHLIRLAGQFPDAGERLVIFDPTDARSSPGLNPLEIDVTREHEAFSRTAELSCILKQRWGVDSFGARTEELMRHVFYTLAVNGCTLVDASALLTSRHFRARLVAQLRNQEVSSYWLDRYEPLSEAMKAAFREPLLNKVSGFVTDPISRHLLGQPRSTLNFAEAMANKQWVIVSLSKGKLRDHAHTLGNLIFAKLQFDVMARAALAEHNRPIFTIFCDEVQNLAENDLVILLTEGRKYGASILSSSQFWGQVPTELRGALLAAGSHILFRLSAHDAGTLASELSVGGRHRHHGQLTMLERGQAIVRVGSSPPEIVKFPTLPDRRVTISPQELRNAARTRYMRDRREIEQEIHARRDAWTRTPLDEANTDEDEQPQPQGQTGW